MSDRKEKQLLEERVKGFIEKNHLTEAGELLLVAVSGGPDSVCLIHILSQLKEKLGIRLHVVHLNHLLRGAESAADAQFVSEIAQNLGITVTVEERDVRTYQKKRRLSLEEAAREVRYSFFAELAQRLGARRVAMGHTANDHIETILMHLVRGSGTRGLTGLRPETFWCSPGHSITVIRPLLTLSRKETEDYCRSQNLPYRIDSSNLSLFPLRNRIRLELLPFLEKYNREIASALMRTARIASCDLAFIDNEIEKIQKKITERAGDTIFLDKRKFLLLPPALKRSLLRRVIETLTGDLRQIEMIHIEDILDILDKGAGKVLHLPRRLIFATDYTRYILSKGEMKLSTLPPLEKELLLKVPGETLIPGWRIVAEIISGEETRSIRGDNLTAHFDYDKVGEGLSVRPLKRGDRFQPLGINALKKVGEFMIDAKVPRPLRGIPIVSSPEQIIWLVGLRIDERVKITDETEKVLRLRFEKSG